MINCAIQQIKQNSNLGEGHMGVHCTFQFSCRPQNIKMLRKIFIGELRDQKK